MIPRIEIHSCRGLPQVIGIMLLGVCALYSAGAFEADETPASCLAAQAHLLEFTAPEKTWAYFLQSLRAADRKAALSAFMQGDLKVGTSATAFKNTW